MSTAEIYHRALSVSPSTSSEPCSPPPVVTEALYGNCEYAAAHLPPAEFIQRYSTTTIACNRLGAGSAGRLSPKSRNIVKRRERRERRAVLKKLRGMVGGNDGCNQLEIIEHVINRIRELQETLALSDASASPPTASALCSVGGVSPAESLASLDSLAWASASDEENAIGTMLSGVSPDSALSSFDSASPIKQQEQREQEQIQMDAAEAHPSRRDDVQRLILQLSSVLSQFGAGANVHC